MRREKLKFNYKFAQKTLPDLDKEISKDYGFDRSRNVLVQDNNETYHVAYYDYDLVHQGWHGTNWRNLNEEPLHNVVTWSEIQKHL